jgi:hypothetical protein
MKYGPYGTLYYMVLTTPSHATKTLKLQQSNSTRCKTKHSPKTNTISTSHSPNDSHNHHVTCTTTSQAQAPIILHSVAQAFQRATRGARRITDYSTCANGG